MDGGWFFDAGVFYYFCGLGLGLGWFGFNGFVGGAAGFLGEGFVGDCCARDTLVVVVALGWGG